MAARLQTASGLLAAFLWAVPCAFALNPALDVSQYAHTAWRFREGFGKGQIFDIAQTADGYLWLASEFGLLRFDGIRAVEWEPPPNQPLPSIEISRLLAARDGTLWIGTRSGLASWKSGKVTQYPELAGLTIFGLLEDREGSVWAGAVGVPNGKLCEIRKGSVKCYTDIKGLGDGVYGLLEDTKGNLWVGLPTGVVRWKPGPPEFYPLPGLPDGVQGMADSGDGALLISMPGGVWRMVNGKAQMAYPLPVAVRGYQAVRTLRDRDGGLWVGTSGAGIVHVHQGQTDVFSQSGGLTGDRVGHFFEDQEGNIWAATLNGLDRFREFPVVTYSTSQGLSGRPTGAFLGAKGGSVWFTTNNGLDRWNDGQITAYGGRAGRKGSAAREIAISGLTNQVFTSLFQDSRGRIWVSTLKGLGFLRNDRFVSAPVPGGQVHAFAEDAKGNLWIAHQDLGLFKLSTDNEVQQIPWTELGHKDLAASLAADPSQGGLWLGFFNGGIAWFRDGQVGASYSAADGLGRGEVNQLQFDGQGALWAATAHGLSRLQNGRITTLTSKNGLPCDAVHWTIEDNDRSVWLMMSCGLVRVARSELDAWAAASQSVRTIHATVLDSSDGLAITAVAGGYTPRVAKSPDGKLWFWNGEGIGVVDPRHPSRNQLPPPVHIEQVRADGKVYDARRGLRLPALVRDVWIDYTALTLVAPEKTRFRYKLEGQDRDWKEVVNDREAQYSNLAPRHYRFRVMAANNSGVWNEAGASLDFSIAPAFYQTGWFRGLCAVAVLALLTLAYQQRARQMRRQFAIRMEERVNERTRIARDLHDTLLQSFQGVLLKFSALQYVIQDRRTKETLEQLLGQARAAVAECRDTVSQLRSSTVVTNDLAHALGLVAEGLAAGHTGGIPPQFRLNVEGKTRDLPPIVRDEVYRIASEALRNAFRHGQAKRIEAEILYERLNLRLRIRDDGKGIDPKILNSGGPAGHFGLAGMKERAKLMGGQLAIWSDLDSGTEVELVVPASLAYKKSASVMASARETG